MTPVLVFVVVETLPVTSPVAWSADLSFPDADLSLPDADLSLSDEGQLIAAGPAGPLRGAPSPAGCRGKSNNPHKDREGQIKGLTQINCNVPVESLRTTAQLWRKRWWGYQMVGAKGDNTNQAAMEVKASSVYEICENNKWRTEGEHWSSEAGNRIFYTHTVRHGPVDKC